MFVMVLLRRSIEKSLINVPAKYRIFLGAPLAKLEAEIALTSFVNKFSHIEKDPVFDF